MPISVLLFLIVIVALVPLLSIYNMQMIESIKDIIFPDKKKLYIQSALNQFFLTSLALWAASNADIVLSYIGSLDKIAILGGVIFLAIAFTVGIITNKNKDLANENVGLELLTPESSSEKITWIMVNIVAATCEEIIFRGVLYSIFLHTTQNVIAASLMSALCFGFSHSIQGYIGIIITTIFGLGLQYLVYLNNGLFIAMVVHFIYNMGTTFIVLKIKKEIKAKIN